MAVKFDIVVEVLREDDGRIYSQVRNRAIPGDRLTRVGGQQRYVVIDRQRGRSMDSETVMNRAKYIADCIGADYNEDLTWPCSAAKGNSHCQCPACIEKTSPKKVKRGR